MKVWEQQENIGFLISQPVKENLNCQLIPKPVLMGRRKLATLFILLLLTFRSCRAGPSLTELCLLTHGLLCLTPTSWSLWFLWDLQTKTPHPSGFQLCLEAQPGSTSQQPCTRAPWETRSLFLSPVRLPAHLAQYFASYCQYIIS